MNLAVKYAPGLHMYDFLWQIMSLQLVFLILSARKKMDS